MATIHMDKLRWFELDDACTQSVEAKVEVKKITDSFSSKSVQAVINASFLEGKTMMICHVIPAHHIIVQAILNLTPSAIKKLYAISISIPSESNMKLSEVVTNKELNPHLLKMKVNDFKVTVELLYYLKEYTLSLFAMALVSLTCSDKTDVILVLSQVTMTCNLCDQPASSSRLYQCLDCSVSSVCVDCMQTDKGFEYLQAHSGSCESIQKLLRPYVQSMKYAHLCRHCFVPLHRHVTKDHFQPEISFQIKKKKRFITYNKAKCSVSKCKRDLCFSCLCANKKNKFVN